MESWVRRYLGNSQALKDLKGTIDDLGVTLCGEPGHVDGFLGFQWRLVAPTPERAWTRRSIYPATISSYPGWRWSPDEVTRELEHTLEYAGSMFKDDLERAGWKQDDNGLWRSPEYWSQVERMKVWSKSVLQGILAPNVLWEAFFGESGRVVSAAGRTTLPPATWRSVGMRRWRPIPLTTTQEVQPDLPSTREDDFANQLIELARRMHRA